MRRHRPERRRTHTCKVNSGQEGRRFTYPVGSVECAAVLGEHLVGAYEEHHEEHDELHCSREEAHGRSTAFALHTRWSKRERCESERGQADTSKDGGQRSGVAGSAAERGRASRRGKRTTDSQRRNTGGNVDGSGVASPLQPLPRCTGLHACPLWRL